MSSVAPGKICCAGHPGEGRIADPGQAGECQCCGDRGGRAPDNQAAQPEVAPGREGQVSPVGQQQ